MYCTKNRSDDIDTLVTPLNREYNTLKSLGWIERATFYMFPNKSGPGICSLFRGSQVVSYNLFTALVVAAHSSLMINQFCY